MVIIQKAQESDLEMLRLCAISAFIDDERYKPVNAKSGGPPGHDSVESHSDWLKTNDYYKCTVHDRIAGGCIIKKQPEHIELSGIFLCSDFIGKGIGSKFLKGVMELYPIDSRWVLETPDYATRNHRFYERNGFVFSKKIEPDVNLGYGFIVYENRGRQLNTAESQGGARVQI